MRRLKRARISPQGAGVLPSSASLLESGDVRGGRTPRLFF